MIRNWHVTVVGTVYRSIVYTMDIASNHNLKCSRGPCENCQESGAGIAPYRFLGIMLALRYLPERICRV